MRPHVKVRQTFALGAWLYHVAFSQACWMSRSQSQNLIPRYPGIFSQASSRLSSSSATAAMLSPSSFPALPSAPFDPPVSLFSNKGSLEYKLLGTACPV